MKKSVHSYLKQAVLSIVLMVVLLASAYSAGQTPISAKGDYITCWKQPCVQVAGSIWSEKNSNGVGISVRMGKQSIATDDQIKTVLTNDLKYYGVTKIKFFFERFEGKSTAIALHVRGGLEGTFFVDEVRKKIPAISKRAKNTNPLFGTNQ